MSPNNTLWSGDANNNDNNINNNNDSYYLRGCICLPENAHGYDGWGDAQAM